MIKEELYTIIDLLERSCRKFPENVYLWEKREGRYQATTYLETREQARFVAAGLIANGLQAGERVALLSEGCNDWVFGELGILYAGGVNVPLSIKLTPRELIFRINHSGARFLFLSAHYLGMIQEIEPEIPEVERIFVFHYALPETGKYASFEQLKKTGCLYTSEYPEDLHGKT